MCKVITIEAVGITSARIEGTLWGEAAPIDVALVMPIAPVVMTSNIRNVNHFGSCNKSGALVT